MADYKLREYKRMEWGVDTMRGLMTKHEAEKINRQYADEGQKVEWVLVEKIWANPGEWFDEMSEIHECMDNTRVARDDESSAAYEDAKDRGCCGYVDTVIECADGHKYHVGFNYGH